MEKLRFFIRNFSHVFSANMISFTFNAMVIIMLPKIIGVAEYGYIQYYTLLLSYAFIMQLGWTDGIYLRYGGQRYEDLDPKVFSQQYYGVVLLSFIQAIGGIILLDASGISSEKHTIFLYAILSIIIILPRIFLTTLLQITNRMREYSLLLISEKAVYGIWLSIMLVSGVSQFEILLLGDIMGKLISLIFGQFCCRNVVFSKPRFMRSILHDIRLNIGAGIYLLLSNVCGLLITGVVQFFIENKWNIETFSKVSLTFNISRMLLVVINTISIVLFPMVKNIDEQMFPNIYLKIRRTIMSVLLPILLIYFPLRGIMVLWLPKYAVSFRYMAFLLPMCVFESKASLLVGTFLKALRKEQKLLLINMIVVCISLALSVISVYVIASLEASILLITSLLFIKSFLLEMVVSKTLRISVLRGIMEELLMACTFAACGWYAGQWIGGAIYLAACAIYLAINRKAVATWHRIGRYLLGKT